MDIELTDLNEQHGEDNQDGDYNQDGYDDHDDEDDFVVNEGNMVEFTNEDLPNDTNRPDIQLINRRRRNLVYRDVDDLFEDVLELEEETRDPRFVDWMIDRGFTIRRIFTESGLVNDYEVKVKSSTFSTLGRGLTEEDFDVLREDIRGEYDYYVEENKKRTLKRVGIASGIGLSLIALITGLALGLKRSGNDLKASTKKWSPIKPGHRIAKKWTPIVPAKEAAGDLITFIGDNIYLIIGGVVTCVYIKRSQ